MKNLKDRAHRILRKSEPYLKMDMVYATKGGFWTGLKFFVGTAISIVTMIAFGNLLPKETYGTYNYLLSLAATLGFLTLSGAGTGVLRAVARGNDSVLSYAVRLQLRYNTIAMATIGAAAIYYWIHGNIVFAISLGVLAISFPVSEALHTFEPFFIGQKRFDLLTVIAILSSILSATATIITIFFTKNVLVLVLVYAVMSTVPNIFGYLYAKRFVSEDKPGKDAIDELRHTSFHLTGAGILGYIAQYIDKIILFQMTGPAILAVYGFAIAGPDRLKGLVKSWISVALPKISERSITEIRKVFYKRLLFSVMIGLSLAVVYIIFSPLLFTWLLPKYLDSIKFSQIYALSLIIIPASIYIGNIFLGQNMLRAVYTQNTMMQISRIVLFILLGWKWQVWGIIIASMASYLANLIYSIIVWEIESRRIMKINEAK